MRVSRRRRGGGGVFAWSHGREYDESAVAMTDPAGTVPMRWAPPRGVMILVGLAAAFIVVAGMRTLQDLIGPVFLALVLTIVVHPIRRMIGGIQDPSCCL